MKTQLSIIIVNYHTEREILNCLSTIKRSKVDIHFEVIVVDNNETDSFKEKLKSKFRFVRYIKTNKNVGYGSANNIGATEAIGTYLFFLNPDTLVYPDTIQRLLGAIKVYKNTAVVAPLLLDRNEHAYRLQGTRQLGVKEGIVALSFMNRLFPNNPIFNNYWMLEWNKEKDVDVDVVPGTAFLIKKYIFEKVGGFDSNFFLFFEESDLCKRIRDRGYKIIMVPKAKVIHLWGSSTKKQTRTFIDKEYQRSKLYYFKKHFGVAQAYIVQIVTCLSLNLLLLFLILSISSFLLTYRLSDLMMFIGDQGWFYLSAKDMMEGKGIPLVGIPSSVVWIHQGALTTYAIVTSFAVGQYHPAAPAYLFALLSIAATYLVYYVGRLYFNEKVGLLSAIFYATSPLIIVSGRMPYHTTPIPLLACFFFIFLYKFLHGNRRYLLYCAFTLGILYQFELSNAILGAILLLLLTLYKSLVNKKLLILSCVSFLVSLIPFILFDFSHKFVQTVGFGLWVANRIRLFFGISFERQTTISNLPGALHVMWQELQRIIFPQSSIIVIIIILLTFIFILIHRNQINKKKPGLLLLLLWLGISLFGFIVHAAPGVAYFPLIYPAICLLIGLSLNYCISKSRYILIFFLCIMIFNAFYTVYNNYFLTTDDSTKVIVPGMLSLGTALGRQIEIASIIVADANNIPFILKGGGFLSMYKSSIDNYRYLVWYKRGNVVDSADLIYIIYPSDETNIVGETLYKNNSVIVSKVIARE